MDQTCTKGISFDVTADGVEVIVLLDREAFETSLVEMPLAGSVVMGVVSHGVSAGHPAKEATHLAVFLRAQHEVPVIRHQLIGQQLRFVLVQPFVEDSLEGLVVFFLVEDSRAGVSPVEGMIEGTSFIGTRRSCHETLPTFRHA